MEGHGDKVECCSAVEMGNCRNYCRVNGKAFKYLLLTEEGRWGQLLPIAPLEHCKKDKNLSQSFNFIFIFKLFLSLGGRACLPVCLSVIPPQTISRLFSFKSLLEPCH